MEQVVEALNEAVTIKDKPIAIISNTVKGKGVSFMENNPKWHSGAISDEEYEIVSDAFDEYLDQVEFDELIDESSKGSR